MTQQPIDWSRDVSLPVSGTTPAARHASASAAMASAPKVSRRAALLLAAFRQYGRLTIAEGAEVTGLKESSVCSTWRALERSGWIVGLGEFFTYELDRRPVRREYHELTARGREVAGIGATK